MGKHAGDTGTESAIDENPDRPQSSGPHVWIVNHYAAAPHKAGGGGRHYYMGRWLNRLGWRPTIIGSTTTHPTGTQAFKNFKPVRKISDGGVDCVWVWSNSYKSGGFMRAVGMVVFSVGVLRPRTTRKLAPPDIVIGSTVHLLAAWVGLCLARRHRATFVYEIRDIWPETLIDFGALRPQSLISRGMKRLSLSLARNASLVLSPLPGVGKYLTENRVHTPYMWLPNGTEETLISHSDDTTRRASSPFTIMYLGSHGRANALDTLLRAFDRACDLCPGANLVLRLVGSGPAKASLQSLASGLHHGGRISFEEKIPRSAVNSRAREADCLIVNLLDRPVYRYGISLNKIYDYLLSARPVIIASNALNDPVKEAGAGLSVPADDIESIANAIAQTYRTDPDELASMGERGREHVIREYSYKVLATRLADALEQLK